jgi:hypothetical protein
MLIRPLPLLDFFVVVVTLSIGLHGGELLNVLRSRALFTRTLLANCVLIPAICMSLKFGPSTTKLNAPGSTRYRRRTLGPGRPMPLCSGSDLRNWSCPSSFIELSKRLGFCIERPLKEHGLPITASRPCAVA